MVCVTNAAGVTGRWCNPKNAYDIVAVLNAEEDTSSTDTTPLAAFDCAAGLLALALLLVASIVLWNPKPHSNIAAKMSTNIKAPSYAKLCWRAPLLHALLSLHLLLDTAAAAPFANNSALQFAVDQWITSPASAEAANGQISDWDTSKVTDMTGLFCADTHSTNAKYGCSGAKAGFNQPISAWDVSQVTSMQFVLRATAAGPMVFVCEDAHPDPPSVTLSSLPHVLPLSRAVSCSMGPKLSTSPLRRGMCHEL